MDKNARLEELRKKAREKRKKEKSTSIEDLRKKAKAKRNQKVKDSVPKEDLEE